MWKKIILVCVLLLLPVLTRAASPTVTGDTSFQYEAIGKLNALYTVRPAVVMGRIINGSLSILGVVALLIIVYAGFNWMTAMGDKAKVQKSIHMKIWSTAGLVLIFTAYVVVRFMFEIVGK